MQIGTIGMMVAMAKRNPVTMKRKTIDQKLKAAFEFSAIRHPKDGTSVYFYDETKDAGQAQGWKESLIRRGYEAYVEERFVEDIIKGHEWRVYDVFVAKK
jgi:hypothetical protein